MNIRLLLLLPAVCIAGEASAQMAGSTPAPKKVITGKAITQRPRRDTIRLEMPHERRFDPANPKLRNAKVKTPLYDNQLTGTHAPGDVHSGIPASPGNHVPAKTSEEKVKDALDSARRPAISN